jgi:multicomponent Na+:H+ antiporter subunit E
LLRPFRWPVSRPRAAFIGKLGLLEVTFSSGQWVIAGVSVFVSLLTTMSMIRLWQYVFWGKPHHAQPVRTGRAPHNAMLMTTGPVAILVALSLLIGVAAQPALDLAQVAADQAIDRAGYVQVVNPELTEADLQILQEPPAQDALRTGGKRGRVSGMSARNVFYVNLLLAVLWAALHADLSVTTTGVGFLFGFLLLSVIHRGYGAAVLGAVGFLIFLVKAIILSSIQVAGYVIAPKLKLDQGIVAIPLAAHTDLEIALLASAITLTPGTISVDVGHDCRRAARALRTQPGDGRRRRRAQNDQTGFRAADSTRDARRSDGMTMENWIDATLIILAVSLMICFVRLYIGPNPPNRAVAFDTIAIHAVGIFRPDRHAQRRAGAARRRHRYGGVGLCRHDDVCPLHRKIERTGLGIGQGVARHDDNRICHHLSHPDRRPLHADQRHRHRAPAGCLVADARRWQGVDGGNQRHLVGRRFLLFRRVSFLPNARIDLFDFRHIADFDCTRWRAPSITTNLPCASNSSTMRWHRPWWINLSQR